MFGSGCADVCKEHEREMKSAHSCGLYLAHIRLTRVLMCETKEELSVDKGSERLLSLGNGRGESESREPQATPIIGRRLPDERRSLTHHFSVGGQEGYVTVGLYEDGLPGELFIRMAKEGSTVSGFMDSFATAVSLALQY